jgi:hypothetical protein
MGEACSMMRNIYAKFYLENLKGRNNSEYIGVEGRVILKWILGK